MSKIKTHTGCGIIVSVVRVCVRNESIIDIPFWIKRSVIKAVWL